MTITKKDFIIEVAKNTGCSKNLASEMANSFFSAMRKSLINGDYLRVLWLMFECVISSQRSQDTDTA